MAYKFLTEPFDLDVMKQEEVRQVFSVKWGIKISLLFLELIQ
jgi:hypothetical protein